MRYFTLKEAEELIPEFEKIFAAVREIAPKAEARHQRVQELSALEHPPQAELALEQAQLDFLIQGMNKWFQKILDLGAVPKGLDPALVDFPHRLNGKEVYLCWQVGEKKITHYHSLNDGFPGRKKLP
jgi:hypothetical protein